MHFQYCATGVHAFLYHIVNIPITPHDYCHLYQKLSQCSEIIRLSYDLCVNWCCWQRDILHFDMHFSDQNSIESTQFRVIKHWEEENIYKIYHSSTCGTSGSSIMNKIDIEYSDACEPLRYIHENVSTIQNLWMPLKQNI